MPLYSGTLWPYLVAWPNWNDCSDRDLLVAEVAKNFGFSRAKLAHPKDNLEDYFVYPIQVPQELSIISIPLLPGDSAPELSDELTGWVQKQLLRRR